MSAPNATEPAGYTGLMMKAGNWDADAAVGWWNGR